MKKGKKRTRKNYIISITLCILSLIMLILFKTIDILPSKYFIPFVIAIVIIDYILCYFTHHKGTKRKVSVVISIVLIIGIFIGIIYELSTIGFLNKLGKNNFKTVTYELIVLNESSINELNDLEDKTIGLMKEADSDYKEAIKTLKEKIDFDDEYYDSNNLVISLLNKDVDAIMLEQSTNKILKEENKDYAKEIKVVDSFEIKVEIEDITKKVDVMSDSFNIYISGIDTYGSVTNSSRSDVNIVLTINPDTRELAITSIPRDYYVTLPSKKSKDKLTHAGIYGIKESVAAIEELLDIDINYYIKVNFTSLIDIVDALKGITIYSDYEFTTKAYDEYTEPYTFYKGKNNLNGKEALAFSRERKAFIDGDRTRNKNQQIVLKAILDKALSPKILENYNSLLKSLSAAFITNMTDEEITSMIKQELDLQKEWKISTYVLDGEDHYDYTYSYKSAKTYVMNPYKESVEKAKEEIKKVLNN
ncbi:MAG: LCP family protein [Bacilli bacterium]